jgi:1-acyl-sn-glycerol-3-phosphate acyltransferase
MPLFYTEDDGIDWINQSKIWIAIEYGVDKLKTTIFDTPVLSNMLHYLARFFLRLFGWKVDGRLPDLPKFVLIGAPHTSNWDFLMFLAIVFVLRANVRFMGKAELFRGPLGWFFHWCGGIPIDRAKSQGMVEQMVQACRESDHFILTIAPEGTRHKVHEWKMGFYHIAKNAGIPVVMAIVDGAQKVMWIGQIFHPTEDTESDIKTIQGFFANMVGINPRLTSELS